MDIKIDQSELGNVISKALPLMREHFKEIHFLKDREFDPDIAYYFSLEDSGHLKFFSVFNDDMLIGYAIYIMRNHPHAKDVKMAYQDAIYISPEYRGNGLGKELIETCDMFLQEMGCNVVFNFVNCKHDFGSMLESVGYNLLDKMFVRRL